MSFHVVVGMPRYFCEGGPGLSSLCVQVSGSGCASFQRVQHAWETLRDPARRRVYDNGLPKSAGFRSFTVEGEVP